MKPSFYQLFAKFVSERMPDNGAESSEATTALADHVKQLVDADVDIGVPGVPEAVAKALRVPPHVAGVYKAFCEWMLAVELPTEDEGGSGWADHSTADLVNNLELIIGELRKRIS